jgi:curli biogenesis system outer membrane secretion channel CsgG
MNKIWAYCLIGCISVLLINCVTKPFPISDQMAQPIIDSEFSEIIESIEMNAPVAVWFCDDNRFIKEPDELYHRTTISHWIESYLEQKVVRAKKFRPVTRTHLEDIFKEQEFQMSGYADDETIVSIGKILGAKFMIVPTITRNSTLNIQVLNIETSEIVYTSDNPVKKNQRIKK